jgi:two-component system, NarL family, nitrate/nitrite response regulator NarL
MLPLPESIQAFSVPSRESQPRDSVRGMVAAAVRLYRDGLAQSLSAAMLVVAVTADAPTTLREAARLSPDVLLLDASMPGALPLVNALAEACPGTRVVAFAVDDAREAEILACAEAGVAGWVGRDASAEDVVEAVLRAARGELLCSARTAALLSQRLAALARERRAPASAPAPAVQLTPREAEIGELLCRGASNKLIARSLGLQLATVKNHVHNILEKLDVRSRAEAGAVLRAPAGSG